MHKPISDTNHKGKTYYFQNGKQRHVLVLVIVQFVLVDLLQRLALFSVRTKSYDEV